MIPIERLRMMSARPTARVLAVAAIPVAAALAIAGCGGSSSAQSDSKTTNQLASSSGAQSASAASHAELTAQSSHYGHTIFDANHRVLYLFAADHTSKSTCYGKCAKAWPPLLTNGTPKVGAGLDSSLLGTTTRRDGSTQVTYAGHPLYYFEGDKPGKIMCQNVKMHGGFWYVVKPNGMANMAKGMGMM
jgi:predicted lipoprotein with Yx(FWY)xxD motif